MSMLDRIMCAVGKCRNCRPIDDQHGVGGYCIACGRIHGWMWHTELRQALDTGIVVDDPRPAPRYALLAFDRPMVIHAFPAARVWPRA